MYLLILLCSLIVVTDRRSYRGFLPSGEISHVEREGFGNRRGSSVPDFVRVSCCLPVHDPGDPYQRTTGRNTVSETGDLGLSVHILTKGGPS